MDVSAIEVFTKDRLRDLGDGEYTLTVDAHPDLTRNGLALDDPHVEPAELGDVLSVQPDGTLQTRPEGTTGNYERCVMSGAGLIYRPIGPEGRTWLVPFTDIWPNG